MRKLMQQLKKIDGDFFFRYGYLEGSISVKDNTIIFYTIQCYLEDHGIFSCFLNRLKKEFEIIEFSVILSDKLAKILWKNGFYAYEKDGCYNMKYNRWENMFDFIISQTSDIEQEIEEIEREVR